MVYCINLLSTYLLVHLTLAGLRPFGRVSHPLRHTARPIYHFHCAKTNIIKMGKIKVLGLGNEELGMGNGKMGNGKIGNREYPYSQSQEMTV